MFIAALPVTLSVWAGETSEWLLAGQEGKCIPLSTLTKKGPEFQDIKSPYLLVEKMRAAGHRAEIKEHTAECRPAVEVRVPSRDLYVMFVKSSAWVPTNPRRSEGGFAGVNLFLPAAVWDDRIV
jgi:hypothetical protein